MTLWAGFDTTKQNVADPDSAVPNAQKMVDVPAPFPYSSAGQWTDDTASARIKEIIAG